MKYFKLSTLGLSVFFSITSLTLSSCKKKSKDPEPTTIKPGEYFFEGSFGDTKLSYNQGRNYFFCDNVFSSKKYYNLNTSQYDYNFNEGSGWVLSEPGVPFIPRAVYSLAISYNTLIPNINTTTFPTEADLKSIYPVGKSTVFYTSAAKPNNSWEISVQDENKNYWYSDNANADQSDSYIDILSTSNEFINNQNVFTIKGSLLCKVYDGKGNSKTLKGNFYQVFSAYYFSNYY
jgi:hypothetical protein